MKALILGVLSIMSLELYAQEPVSWTYTVKKVNALTYEVHLTASIDNGWHMYSQVQPADAIAQPTKITFIKNPLLSIEGAVKESGKPEIYKDVTLGVSARQYLDKVDFIQVVKLKRPIKTSIGGTISYQVCTEERCMPPATVNFSVKI